MSARDLTDRLPPQQGSRRGDGKFCRERPLLPGGKRDHSNQVIDFSTIFIWHADC
jgi:hypothetical protein